MKELNCGECALYRTPECRPDKCLPGFRLFVDPIGDVWGRCDCGGKLLVLRSHNYSRKAREVKLVCAKCHVVWKETAAREKVKTGDTDGI